MNTMFHIRNHLASLLIGLCCTFFAMLANADSTPAFWKVESKTATVYLLGSMHFGHKKFYPLPKSVNAAFIGSQVLAVEMDITKIEPLQAMASVMKHARLPTGQTLSTVLKPETLALLAQQAKKGGLPLQALQSFQPWFAAMQLVEAELRKTEYKPNLGVDHYYLSHADDKKVVALETMDSQLALFSNLSIPLQESFLKQTLMEISGSGDYLNVLAEQWRVGDITALEKTLISPFAKEPAARAFFKALFTDRNHQMAQSALAYLKGDKTVFFMVGAGHMLGKDGIVALLAQAGYTPTMLSPVLSSGAAKIQRRSKPRGKR